MFYDKFKELCDLKGVSVSKAASEIGLSNSTATKWKKTGATPDSSTIAKAASYFDVPTDYFMDDVIFGDSLENIIKEESDRLGIAESELKKAFLQRRGSAKILNRESVSEYFDSVYKKAPTPEGERTVGTNVLNGSVVFQTDNPTGALMDQYMIPSDVMDVVAGAKPGSSAAWKDGLGVPTKEQYQKLAEFFELDESALERGVLPLRPSEKVWGKLAERTEERFPHSLAAQKAVQKYAADSSEENYKELVSCLKGLSPDVQKKIVLEFLTP